MLRYLTYKARAKFFFRLIHLPDVFDYFHLGIIFILAGKISSHKLINRHMIYIT